MTPSRIDPPASLAQAIADIGDVLTPDQRAKLARRMDF